MPRGRRKRVIQATTPPRRYYWADQALNEAVRERRISWGAACLWCHIRMLAWETGECDPTDAYLAHWMGGITTREVRNMRAELREAGLLSEHRKGGVRWMVPLPRGIHRNSYSGELVFPGMEEEDIYYPEHPDDPPPGPVQEARIHRNDGSGKNQFTGTPIPGNTDSGESRFSGTPVPLNSDEQVELAALLAEAGVFPHLAGRLAGDLLAEMPLQDARTWVQAHLRDLRAEGANGSGHAGKLVWRLQHHVRPSEESLAWVDAQAEEAPSDPSLPVGQAGAPDDLGDPVGDPIWQRALDDLALRMPSDVFQHLLLGSRCLGMEADDTLVVRVANRQAKAWLEGRLRDRVRQVVCQAAEREDVDVRFVIDDQQDEVDT